MGDRWRFLPLPYTVIAIVLGTLMSRFGTSMVVPYITLLLVSVEHLPIYYAGIAIGASYLSQAFGASLLGGILKHTTPFVIIQRMLCVYAVLFCVMGLASRFVPVGWLVGAVFILCLFSVGICRSLIETLGQMVISDITPQGKKNLAFSLRYTFINIGTSFGPIVAIALGVLNTDMAFYVGGLAIFAYFLLLRFTVSDGMSVAQQHSARGSLLALGQLLMHDRKLRYFTLASILCSAGFGQMETLFAYILHEHAQSADIFPVMYAINGISIIFLQMPLVRFVQRFDIHSVIMLGIVLLAAGLLGVMLSTVHAYGYYISIFIFTLGEIFTVSLTGIYIDRIAPPEKRYLYFGVDNLRWIGSMVGPGIATFLCYYFGLMAGEAIMIVITLFAAPCIYFASRAPLDI